MWEQIASPACTDLEVVMMDWLGQLLGLPSQFLACSGGTGGGVIQVS
jgi:aromatic-L-amino-acid decarboxylase